MLASAPFADAEDARTQSDQEPQLSERCLADHRNMHGAEFQRTCLCAEDVQSNVLPSAGCLSACWLALMPGSCSTHIICVAQHLAKHATVGRLLQVSALAALTALKLHHCRGLQRCANHVCVYVGQQFLEHAAVGRLLPVSALAALTALKLQHCRGLQRCADLAPLAGLTALSALSLCGCTELQVGSLTACADASTCTWLRTASALAPVAGQLLCTDDPWRQGMHRIAEMQASCCLMSVLAAWAFVSASTP